MESLSEENYTLLCGIFGNAITFDIAGQMLSDQVNLSSEHSQSWDTRFRGASVGWPWQVNEAFAVELYIKSVLVIENNMSSGHELKKLFAKISVPVQKEIREIYNNEIKIQPWFQELLSGYSHVLGHHRFELDDVLDDASNVFVVYRYSHENYTNYELYKPLHIHPIKMVLYRWIVRRRPELHRAWMRHS